MNLYNVLSNRYVGMSNFERLFAQKFGGTGGKIKELEGVLPLTFTANGQPLLDYCIYGASGGVGEPTENLIDANKPNVEQRVEVKRGEIYCLSKYEQRGSYGRPTYAIYDENGNMIRSDYLSAWMSASFIIPNNGKYAIIYFGSSYAGIVSFVKGAGPDNNTPYPENYIPYGYKLPMVSNRNLFDAPPETYMPNSYKKEDGTMGTYPGGGYFDYYIPIANERIYLENIHGDNINPCRLYFYDSDKNWISRSDGYTTDFSIVPPTRAKYIQIQCATAYVSFPSDIVITQDLNKTTTPIYIGDAKLMQDEYVSFSEGKIYRKVNGTLTPTDPPVPLPALPTIKGETVIDYDGTPKPSQMYIKYKS